MKTKSKKRGLTPVLSALLLILLASTANASLILRFDGSSVSSNTPATGAAADIAFGFTAAIAPPTPSGDLTLSLTVTNTTGQAPNPLPGSSGATQASLMGFGFDLPTGVSVLEGYYSVSPATSLPYLLANVGINPFGGVDVYFSNNSNPTGGNPSGALSAGQSATIEIDLITSIALADIEQAFVDVLSLNCPSTGSSCTDELATSIARFQRVNGSGAGSDKLLGYVVSNGGGGEIVPEPSTLLLSALGLIGMGLFGRGRRLR